MSEIKRVSEAAFTALQSQSGVTGRYYTRTDEPGVDKPWRTLDFSVTPRTWGEFATEVEAQAFFANAGPPASETPVEPLPYAPDPQTATGDASVEARGQSETVSDGLIEENPFAVLSEDELAEKIRQHELRYHSVARRCQDVETVVTTLRAEFDEKHGETIKEHKALKDAAILAKEELKLIAADYARRHPTDKQFDIFIGFKEFEDVFLDEVEALRWARENYPLAIIPAVGERLDVKQVIEVIKSLKRNKKDIPPFVEFKPRVEVQVSSKLPAEIESPTVSYQPGIAPPGTVQELIHNSAMTEAPDPTTLDPKDPMYTPF